MISIISRESPLARVQVEEFIGKFPDMEFSVNWVKSMGDVDLRSSLMSQNIAPDFFTRELDIAILNGEADIAVHSAKDLPWPLPQGLSVIALLEADDQSDSLVSKNGMTLADLPMGARLGTSSISRKEQILAIRPDLEIVSIRGNIGQRLEYLDRNEADAVIVATCALKRLGLANLISEILPIATHDLQGNLAVVAKTSRSDLAGSFQKRDIRTAYGSVTLVGAGPGDPDLLTVKAVKALKQADIIYYDALSGEAVLAESEAEKQFVGKRKGEHSLSQNEINRILYSAAREGKNVVRLKAGDPLLFSRGGEEIRYLSERLISVSVIPGISSFQAAAASANMPLTMRNYSRKFTASSGHYETDRPIPVEKEGTQAFFMAVTKLDKLKKSLLKAGRPGDTPILLVHNVSHRSEITVTTTIDRLSDVRIPTPAMIIVGEVASLAVQPERLLFTGLDPSRLRFKQQLVPFPLIKTEAIADIQVDIEKYDALLFTSRSAVRYFLKNHSVHPNQIVFAVGPHTADFLIENGISVDFMPDIYDAEHLAPIVETKNCKSILYPCSQLSDNKLHRLVNVSPVPFYRTVMPEQTECPELDFFNGVIFSSPSTVDAFFKLYESVPASLIFYVYGKSSLNRLLSYGIEKHRILNVQL